MVDWPKLADIAASVREGKVSAVDMVDKSLEAIESAKEYDSTVSVIKERARMRAVEVDKNKKGRLAGVPFIAKDNFLTLGTTSTASAKYLKDFESPYQATAIERLEGEGAICVGKSNLDAWAHGSSTENSDFFVTKNPHDKTRVPGGSSGGSAAAVALGLVPFALGTDTAGSIRQPASFCGVVGYKPSYGLVSRSGVVAMASSADVIGPITKSSEDSALVLDVMAGKDVLDSTTVDKPVDNLDQLDFSWKGQKVGVVQEYMGDGIEPGVKIGIIKAIDKLKKAGAQVEEVSMPSSALALAVYQVICPAEVSSNLARYDGQRYGYIASGAKDLLESYELAREQGFGAEAKRRIMIGTHVLSSGHYDAYYKKAQTVRTKIINEHVEAFTKCDFLVGPTAPTPAFKIGAVTDPLAMYLSDILTVAANISGNPSISVPAGQSEGLPIGLQIIGPMLGDREVLAAAKSYEELA